MRGVSNKHCLLTFFIRIFVLSIFEWLFYTGFTVYGPEHENSVLMASVISEGSDKSVILCCMYTQSMDIHGSKLPTIHINYSVLNSILIQLHLAASSCLIFSGQSFFIS